MATFDLKAYARRGAEARLAELNQEIETIYAAFPDLRRENGRARLAATRRSAVRRRGMSAAQRKAVSERMRKYWAARRKETLKK